MANRVTGPALVVASAEWFADALPAHRLTAPEPVIYAGAWRWTTFPEYRSVLGLQAAAAAALPGAVIDAGEVPRRSSDAGRRR